MSGTAARWKALVLWKARGTIVVREGIANEVAEETLRSFIRDAAVAGVMFGVMFVGSMPDVSESVFVVDDL